MYKKLCQILKQAVSDYKADKANYIASRSLDYPDRPRLCLRYKTQSNNVGAFYFNDDISKHISFERNNVLTFSGAECSKSSENRSRLDLLTVVGCLRSIGLTSKTRVQDIVVRTDSGTSFAARSAMRKGEYVLLVFEREDSRSTRGV